MQQKLTSVLCRGKRAAHASELPDKQIEETISGNKPQSSSLIRLLESQYSSRNKSSNAEEKQKVPAGHRTSIPFRTKQAEFLSEGPALVEPNQLPAAARRDLNTEVTGTKLCPLCGTQISGSDYDAHLADEVEHLEDSDNEWDVWLTAADAGREPPSMQGPSIVRNRLKRVASLEKEKKVYVLGGAPSVAVPKNPKRLKMVEIPRRPWVPTAAVYNHYNDKAEFIDGELIGVEGEYSGETVTLPLHFGDQGTFVIGRSSSCEVTLPRDDQISRRHVEGQARDGKLFIRDLGSTYGTSLNGTAVGDDYVQVRPGDVISVGTSSFRLQALVVLAASA